MDAIREFDIRLEREMYYAGEILQGHVVLDTIESFKVRAIRVILRGKAHAEWKVMVSGDRRTVKDDQYFIDDRSVIWGKGDSSALAFAPQGGKFMLLLAMFGKVTVDMPYASPPQGMKYFTIIGPHIDCMDEQYLKPMCGEDKRSMCCLCCARGPVTLRTQLERTAYVCGESIKLKAEIDNQSEEDATLKIKLVQYVEYYLERGVLGVTKDSQHAVLEFTGDPVATGGRWKFDSSQCLVVPVNIEQNVCCDHVEGGMYIGPEFQLGQVYDGGGDGTAGEPVLLYRPVYVCIPNVITTTPSAKSRKMIFDNSSRSASRSGSVLNKMGSSSAGLQSNFSKGPSGSAEGERAGSREKSTERKAGSGLKKDSEATDVIDVKLEEKIGRNLSTKSLKDSHSRNSF
ncbi:arrestin domain-containing protein 3 [Hyalella azteca]|uniref:Arrestin domain-containing protein 3 n=1 Tax=Hyalella azteca TaxID=294128 RepID=A0A979FMA2_HYAAZ|nr:arrestin domain-containing protein 3 [Hyalella azteca]